MQFIVISLKTGFFQGSEALVGVYRDQGANSSKVLTLDVSHSYPRILILRQFANVRIAAEVSVIVNLLFEFKTFQIALLQPALSCVPRFTAI